jgi:pyrroline-5-carboxylate reductase
MKVAFVGAGMMGEAIIKGVLDKGLLSPIDICACDIVSQRLEHLQSTYGIKVTEDKTAALDGADVIVLAVKPQNMVELIPPLKGRIAKEQLVISIIAGVTMTTLSAGLGHGCIVRSMPNTPAQIGAGICVWTASSEVNQQQKDMARSILTALGREIYVPSEDYIDMATAVSGSGPGYIFLIIESLTAAAVRIGLPPDMANELVLETIYGAACLAKETGKSPKELRENVTSPGGTTAAGLARLNEGKLGDLIASAVEAAYERAKEIGES